MEPHYYETYYQHETRHWWFRWRYDLVSRVLKTLPDPGRRPLMLDAGCGTGQMLRHLQRSGDAVGLDLSGEALTFASSRGAPNLVRGSVTDPPFARQSFDRIFALDVIEHVDDDRQMIAGLYDLLRPGGVLVITVPAYQSLWSDHDRINHHRRRYVVDEVEARLLEAGFEIDRLTYCNTLLFPAVYVARRTRAIFQRRRQRPDDQLSSDLESYPAAVNNALYRLLQLENWLLEHVKPPFGVSILAVARRPVGATSGAASTRRAEVAEAPDPVHAGRP